VAQALSGEIFMIGTVARMGHNVLMVAFFLVTVVLVLQVI
jgi:hypothetical protein